MLRWTLHYLQKTPNTEEHIAHSTNQNMRTVAGAPGYQAWFAARKHNYTEEFVRKLTDEIQQASRHKTWNEKANQHNET